MGPRADPTPSSGFVLLEMRIHVNDYSVEGCLNMLLFPNLFWTARLILWKGRCDKCISYLEEDLRGQRFLMFQWQPSARLSLSDYRITASESSGVLNIFFYSAPFTEIIFLVQEVPQNTCKRTGNSSLNKGLNFGALVSPRKPSDQAKYLKKFFLQN